jgi:hypothetical protein
MPDAAYACAALMLSMLENSDRSYLRSNDTAPTHSRQAPTSHVRCAGAGLYRA